MINYVHDDAVLENLDDELQTKKKTKSMTMFDERPS